MEKVRSLKAEFFIAVTVALLAVVLASAATIYGCWRLQRWLVPDPNEVILCARLTRGGETVEEKMCRLAMDGGEKQFNWLTQIGDEGGVEFDMRDASFSVRSVEHSISQNGPRRKLAYLAAGASMAAFPVIYSAAGVLTCAFWFYRRKLAPAITVLDDATRHISERDLDFTVSCPLQNELGRLCASFERMRQALYDNNLQLWRTIEERRTMQASIAHDLRNPLAIIAGYVEYMQQNIGALSGEKLEQILRNLTVTTKRMERYTDYIRGLDAIEDTEIRPAAVTFPDFLCDAADSVQVLAGHRELRIISIFDTPACRVELDREIFYRVLENVFSNAARYAGEAISLSFALARGTLTVRVSDDGPGFSEQMLKKKNSLYYSEDLTGEHMGLGLATSRILCEKHGGGIRLSNRSPHGASVEITLAVKRI